MISLGLTASQQLDLLGLLYSHHTINITVRLLDTSHRYYEDLSDRFVDGTVTIDADATEADRALDLVLYDPLAQIQLDPDSPSPSSVFITHMISIIYSVGAPDGSRVYNIPVFCGPIDDVDRTGPILSLKCLGKEVLASDTFWWARTFNPGADKSNIIRSLLVETGELKLDLGTKTGQITRVLSLARGEAKAWPEAKALAKSLSCTLFFDGRGVAVMRPIDQVTRHWFNETNIKSAPQVGYDLKSASNAVEVLGAIPKGSKRALIRRKVAPDSHPLSPKRLARNGHDRIINPIFINDTDLHYQYQVDALANRTLDDALLEATEATVEVMPNPLLEPYDIGEIDWGNTQVKTRIIKATLPLRNTGSSTIGYLKRTTTKGKPPIRKRT